MQRNTPQDSRHESAEETPMYAHKTTASLALLLVFVSSLFPAVAAEGVSANVSADITTTDQRATNEASIDGRVTVETPATDKGKDEAAKNPAKERDARKKARELLKEERLQERQGRMQEKTERQVERMKEGFTDVRAHQQERIKAAKERCSQAPQPEACATALDARLEKVTELAEKDLALLNKIQQNREERLASITKLKSQAAFKKYKEKDARARLVASATVEAARKRFQEAKDKEQEARKRLKEQQGEIKDLKGKAKSSCKEDSTASACTEAKAAVAAKAKESLLHAANAALEALAKVTSKISESEDLTDQEEADLAATVSAHVKAISDAKTAIEALGTNATAADVQALAKELRQAVAKAKEEGKGVSQLLVAFRMGGIIVQSKHLEARLTAVLEKATEKGKDVSAIDSDVDAFHAKLEAAAAAHAKARASLLTGKIRPGQGFIKEAKAALEESRALIKKIFKALQDQDLDEELQAQDVEAEVAAASTASTAPSPEPEEAASTTNPEGGDQP